MIQYLLLQNRQGKTRLSKYYRAYTDDERNKIEGDVHGIVTTRDPKFTNFVEVRGLARAPRAAAFSLRSCPLPPRSTHNTSGFTGGMRGFSSPSAST